MVLRVLPGLLECSSWRGPVGLALCGVYASRLVSAKVRSRKYMMILGYWTVSWAQCKDCRREF